MSSEPLRDRRGVPICRGDLVRTPHFRTRRRKYWLYHVAVGDPIQLVPAQYLDPGVEDTGGRCFLTQDLASVCEVIAGYGPGECLDYDDREKVKT
jgi:hypothetical protein